jgi:hypothetical protein
MRNLFHDRKGATAFATVIALVPLIGAIALGAEAGSWYVTQQHAQNAADGAAYSGGLTLACSLGSSCNETQPAASRVAYRGKEFAAQNGFCNAGDTSYPDSQCPSSLAKGSSQAVTINTLATWNGVSGNFVQALVQQTQPAYLAGVLGSSTIPISAQAVVQVTSSGSPCLLALTGSISLQGSASVTSPGCGMASNETAPTALSFTGNGIYLPPGLPLSASGGCSANSSNYCQNALTYQPPATDPFSPLDNDLIKLCGANPPLGTTCGLSSCPTTSGLLVPYTATNQCTNNGFTLPNKTADPLTPGVYFISGTLTLNGQSSITGSGVTLILLPGANIQAQGGATLTLTGPTNAPSTSSLPTNLQSDASLLQYMALYDVPCPLCATTITFGGNSGLNFTGNIYAPDAAVTLQGNPVLTIAVGSKGCGEVIAGSIAFNGNPTIDDSGCTTAQQPINQVVALVQ